MSYWCAHECKYNVFEKDSYLQARSQDFLKWGSKIKGAAENFAN